MARFRADRDSADTPEESTSWREWSRQADENRFDADLAQIDSEIETFGDSAAEGFSSAWGSADESEVKPLPEDADDEARAQRLRNMDRRFSPVRVGAVVLAIAILIGAAVGVQRLREPEDSASGLEGNGALLIPPGQERTYAEGAAALGNLSGWELEDAFVSESAAASPQPAQDPPVTFARDVRAAPLVWGGRAHVVIVGAGVGATDVCAVSSLFSSDLEVIDVAADGACGERFAATGDRLACRSENVVLLEVWPRDPGITAEQPDVTRVRVRLERERATGDIASLRVTVDLEEPFETGLRELAAAPAVEPSFSIDQGFPGMCQLLDRSDVTVQLL